MFIDSMTHHDMFVVDVEENVENLAFLCSTKSCIKKETFIKFSLMDRYCCNIVESVLNFEKSPDSKTECA